MESNEGDESFQDGALASLVFTLDPKAKYTPLNDRQTEALSTPQAQEPEAQQSQGVAKVESSHEPPPPLCTASGQDPECSPSRGLYSAFQRLRRTKSSGVSAQKDPGRLGSSWSRKLLSRAKSSRKATAHEAVPEVPKIDLELLQKMQTCDGAARAGRVWPGLGQADIPGHLPQQGVSDELLVHKPHHSARAASDVPSPLGSDDCEQKSFETPISSLVASPESASSITRDSMSESRLTKVQHKKVEEQVHLNSWPLASDSQSWKESESQRDEFPALETGDQQKQADDPCQLEPAGSFTSSDYCPPDLTSNTASSRRISSIRLSQPQSPQMLEFHDGNDDLAWQSNTAPDIECHNMPDDPTEHFGYNVCHPFKSLHHSHVDTMGPAHGFQGYSLPIRDQASSVTIKKPPMPCGEVPPLPRHASAQLVHSWDDGTPQRLTGAGAMMDELGYLGGLIT